MELLKISSSSKPRFVAGAIAAILRNNESVEIQAIGAAAVNQAVKSMAVAKTYVIEDGIELICIPVFVQILAGGEKRTAIKFHICAR